MHRKRMLNPCGKKSQAWVLDTFFALLVFIAVLIVFFKAEVNFSNDDEATLNDMLFESKLVGDALLSAGAPLNWNASNVTKIGITNNYRINETKLAQFISLNYSSTKRLLHTKYNYYIFFEGINGILDINTSKEGVGKQGVNSTNIIEVENPSDLVKATRYVIFRSTLSRLVIYLWQE